MTGAAVLGLRIDGGDVDAIADRIVARATTGQPAYACLVNAHMAVETRRREFRACVEAATFRVPDGMPIAWLMRWRGLRGQPRVDGFSLTVALCSRAARAGLPIALVGGRPEILARMHDRLVADHPGLRIAYRSSPAFGALEAESPAIVEALRASGARLALVGLGCPKQELWMARMHRDCPGTMVGVGAVFDFMAGAVPRAPEWMRRCGLEWSFRLGREPLRLWRRYLIGIPRFLALVAVDLVRRDRRWDGDAA